MNSDYDTVVLVHVVEPEALHWTMAEHIMERAVPF